MALGCQAEKAPVGQTKRQKQRPRQSQQLPDHMIADRRQGQRRKVACRSGRAQDKVRMSEERERERETREDTEDKERLQDGGETQKHSGQDSRKKERENTERTAELLAGGCMPPPTSQAAVYIHVCPDCVFRFGFWRAISFVTYYSPSLASGSPVSSLSCLLSLQTVCVSVCMCVGGCVCVEAHTDTKIRVKFLVCAHTLGLTLGAHF